jgi:hypothetical protein
MNRKQYENNTKTIYESDKVHINHINHMNHIKMTEFNTLGQNLYGSERIRKHRGGIRIMKRSTFILWLLVLINLMLQFFLIPQPAFSKAEVNTSKKMSDQNKKDLKDDQAEVENRPLTFIGTLIESRRTVDVKSGQSEANGSKGGSGTVVHIAQNSQGELYVAKNQPVGIAVYSKDGKFLSQFGKEGGNPGQLLQPFSIAIDNQDRVFVCDVTRGKILVFTASGEFLEEFSSKSAVAADDKYPNTSPGCIAIDKKNSRLYISDVSNGHIWIHDLHGKFLQYFKGKDQGLFCSPGVVCFDNQNRIYVPEGMCDRIRVFKQDGTALFQIGGESGDRAGQFSRLTGIGIDSRSRVYATDLLLKCIQIFSPEGKFVGAAKWLDVKADKTYFEMPTGIFIGRDDSIFVTDQEVNQVYIVKDSSKK